MKKARVFVLLCLAAPILFCGAAYAEKDEAIVRLISFQAPQSIGKEQVFEVYADFSLVKAIQNKASVFLHIVNPADGEILINADFSPKPAISAWSPGEIVGLGPIYLYAPREIPSGEYDIRMGITAKGQGADGPSYIKMPYVNSEIENFIVGKIVFEDAKAEPEGDQEYKELILSDFKDEADVNKWEGRHASIKLFKITNPVGEVTFSPWAKYPAIMLDSYFKRSGDKFKDWSGYDYIELEVYQKKDKSGSSAFFREYVIQLKDVWGKGHKYFVPEPPQQGTPVRIPLSEFSTAIDLRNISSFTFFTGSVPFEYTFYVSYVKLVTSPEYRGKGPFVKFDGIDLPKEQIYPGEDLSFAFNFTLSRKFFHDHNLFIHIFNPEKKAETYINADVDPRLPTTEWAVGAPIKEGPFNVHIPDSFPPGKYVIEAGFAISYTPPPGSVYAKYHRAKNGVFYIDQPRDTVDYFKQPYINYQDYGDWIVGSFEVLAAGE
ncbi:MAG: hypothetical protein ABH825_02695 [Candidatus Omnitrophota bacterium]